MNLQVLSLKVLATRQVVKNRLNYSTYLNGTVKDELDRLDRIEGNFRIEASKLTVEAHYKGMRLPDDWGIFKECFKDDLPSSLIKFIEGYKGFKIVEENDERLMRNWYISDVDSRKKNLLYCKGNLFQMNGHLFQFDDFIEDGWFVNVQKAFKMNNGRMEFVSHYQESITTNKQGNVIRRYMWTAPNKDIKITKVMWACRVFNGSPFWPWM